jgi:hypothetical protein
VSPLAGFLMSLDTVSPPYSQSLPLSSQSPPIARHGRAHVPGPSEPTSLELQANTGSTSSASLVVPYAQSSQASKPPVNPARFRPSERRRKGPTQRSFPGHDQRFASVARMAKFETSSIRTVIITRASQPLPTLPILQERPDGAQHHAERLSVSLPSAWPTHLVRGLTDPREMRRLAFCGAMDDPSRL